MRYDDRNYWVCPKCLGEFWPQEKERGEYQKRKVTTNINSLFYHGLAESTYWINHKPELPPGEPCFKGGSKCGKKRKKPQKKNVGFMYET